MFLEWENSRWHLDGKPIHAGCNLELQWPDGTWEIVRIESRESGQVLLAYFRHFGFLASARVDPNGPNSVPVMRWPEPVPFFASDLAKSRAGKAVGA